jgi:rSAM/selenodomain-associated transferase 1
MNRTTSFVIFAKTPNLGAVKTRMEPWLTKTGSLQLHVHLLRHAVYQVKKLQYPSLERAIFLTSFKKKFLEELTKWTGSAGFSVHCQKGLDLGERLAGAVELKFRQGFRKVVIIGTDCPLIGPREFHLALEALNNHEVVLGPAEDGGYYLIGFSAPKTFLFRGIHWGTVNVFQETIALLKSNSVSWMELPSSIDLDTYQDLRNFLARVGSHPQPNQAKSFRELHQCIMQLIQKSTDLGTCSLLL